MKKSLLVIPAVIAFLAGCKGSAEITYDCSVNGAGAVECIFHNVGDRKGSVCIQATLVNHARRSIQSDAICSGIVAAKDVVERRQSASFTQRPADFCKNPNAYRGSTWVDHCTIRFEEAPK